MIATEDHYIKVTEKELASLIRRSIGKPIDIAFGIGGTALKWTKGEKMPWYVKKLGLMRGVMNENMNGAGI